MGRVLLADGRLTKMLDMVLGEVASYTPAIPLRGRELKFRFRDRVEELSAIARFPFAGNPLAIVYGPRGCGKSELFRALLYGAGRVYDRGSSLEVLLALEGRGDVVDIAYTRGFERPVREVLGAGNLGYGVQAGLTLGLPNVTSLTLGFGVSIEPRNLDYARALLAWRVIQKLGEVAEASRDYIVVVDEYRGVTEGELHALAEKMADPLGALYIKLRERLGSTVKLYITTSDSTVASKISRSTIKYRKLLMWNLPRSSFEEIVEELKSWAKSLGLSLEELAWSLFGGNVRELLEASNNGLTVWLENLVSVIRRAVEVTMRSRGLTEHDVMEELRGAEGLGTLKIYDAMLGENAVIEYYATDFLSELPKEPWVSRYTAFQIPAYYHVLRAIVLEGEVDVGPRRVLEVLVKS
jgi:energy-coupling factor transporter ATP-binding protein EcfA2